MSFFSNAKTFATQLRHLHLWIGSVLLLIFGGLFAANAQRSFQAYREELQHDLITAQTEVRMRLEDTIEYLSLLASELAQEKLAVSAFKDRAQGFGQHHPEVKAIGWIQREGELSWSDLPSPRDLPVSLQRNELQEALASARRTQLPAMSQVFRTASGQKVFAVFVPLSQDPAKLEVLFCLVSIDALIDSVLPDWINNRYDISVLDAHNQTLAREAVPGILDRDLVAVSPAISPHLGLRIRLQRYQEGHDWQSILLMALSLGVVLGVAIAVKELNADRKQKRELAIKMRQAKELAEAANRMKSEFVANVSHELRTPLTAIIGYSDLLIRELPHPPRLETRLQTIAKNAQHLLLLINDLLDHSKIEAGFLAINEAPIHLPDFLTELLLSCSSLAYAKNLRLSLGTIGRVPLILQSDPLRYKQILTNLIGNAIKFTESGEVDIRLRLLREEGQTRGTLECSVRDTGIGISDDQKNRIFGAFAQADSFIAQRFGGTGLGLSLSRELATRLHGEVVLVSSSIDQGSCFACRVPIDLPPESEGDAWFEIQNLEAPPHSSAPQDPLPALDKRRILLVEDSQDNQLLICAYLERTGAYVVCSDEGESAIQRVAAGEHYDAVLMDIQLPGMDGYATSRALRAMGFKSPIIALTAQTAAGEEDRCASAGCQAYLAKPFDPHLLIETLRDLSSPVSHSQGPLPILSKLSADASLRSIVSGFVHRLPERLAAMEGATQDGDWAKLARIAHTLKGTAANFGYTDLAAAAARLEELTQEAEPQEGVRRSCQLLRQLVEQMHRGIELQDG